MTRPLATTVDDAYRVCHPEKPLEANDERYVDLTQARGMKNFAQTVARRIVRSMPEFHQQLVTGHRGCGKSTELLRLKAELESQGFFTVYLDTEEILDLGEVDYLDVLLVIARSVEETLREMGMGMDEALLQEVRDWFADKVLTDDKIHEVETEAGAGLDIGPAVPFLGSLLASLTGKIKSGPAATVDPGQRRRGARSHAPGAAGLRRRRAHHPGGGAGRGEHHPARIRPFTAQPRPGHPAPSGAGKAGAGGRGFCPPVEPRKAW